MRWRRRSVYHLHRGGRLYWISVWQNRLTNFHATIDDGLFCLPGLKALSHLRTNGVDILLGCVGDLLGAVVDEHVAVLVEFVGDSGEAVGHGRGRSPVG